MRVNSGFLSSSSWGRKASLRAATVVWMWLQEPEGQARTPTCTLGAGLSRSFPFYCILKQGPQPLPNHPQQPFVAVCPSQLSPSTGLSSLEWKEGPLMTGTRKGA